MTEETTTTETVANETAETTTAEASIVGGANETKAEETTTEETKVEGEVKTEEETKTEEGKLEEKAEEEKKPEAKTIRAPEKYELKTAEGVTLNADVQTKFETIARELDLPQADAQKLLDLAPEFSKMYNSQLIETAAQTFKKWGEETKADVEIGGSGDQATYDKNLSYVALAREKFATNELKSLLEPFDAKTNPNGTGFGNHPEVTRLFMKIGKSISPDGTIVKGESGSTAQDHADRLYGQKQ